MDRARHTGDSDCKRLEPRQCDLLGDVIEDNFDFHAGADVVVRNPDQVGCRGRSGAEHTLIRFLLRISRKRLTTNLASLHAFKRAKSSLGNLRLLGDAQTLT